MKPIAGVCVLMLAACGGSGSGGGDDTILSSGILEIELPDGASRADLSPELQDLVTDVENANENGGPATQPSGATTYSGTFGAGIVDSEALFSGDATVNIDGSADVDYTFTVTSIDDPENPGSTASGSFGGTADSTSGGTYTGGLAGSITLDQGSGDIILSVGGDVDGAFDANNNAFGSMDGSVMGGGIDDRFTGIFFAPED